MNHPIRFRALACALVASGISFLSACGGLPTATWTLDNAGRLGTKGGTKAASKEALPSSTALLTASIEQRYHAYFQAMKTALKAGRVKSPSHLKPAIRLSLAWKTAGIKELEIKLQETFQQKLTALAGPAAGKDAQLPLVSREAITDGSQVADLLEPQDARMYEWINSWQRFEGRAELTSAKLVYYNNSSVGGTKKPAHGVSVDLNTAVRFPFGDDSLQYLSRYLFIEVDQILVLSAASSVFGTNDVRYSVPRMPLSEFDVLDVMMPEGLTVSQVSLPPPFPGNICSSEPYLLSSLKNYVAHLDQPTPPASNANVFDQALTPVGSEKPPVTQATLDRLTKGPSIPTLASLPPVQEGVTPDQARGHIAQPGAFFVQPGVPGNVMLPQQGIPCGVGGAVAPGGGIIIQGGALPGGIGVPPPGANFGGGVIPGNVVPGAVVPGNVGPDVFNQ